MLSLPKIKTDTGIAAFARGATITRLHLRYTKDTPPDDLVFKAVSPISGGVPEMKEPGPAKTNRFQGRYVMWVSGCGSGLGLGLGGGGFFSSGSPLNRPQSTLTKLVDPLEELLIADLPALDLKARPLRKDAPALQVNLDAQPMTPTPVFRGPPSRVQDARPIVVGDMDKDLISRVVKRALPQIRACYERALLKNPTLQGKVVVKFITAAGAVSESSIASSSIGDAEVEACVVGRVRTWAFPASAGQVQVAYPFVMTVNGQ